MKQKICRVCGQPFDPKSSRQLDCNRTIFKTCEVCGKQYAGKCSKNDVSNTCSAECAQKLAAQKRTASYSDTTRTCEICGTVFHPTTNTQKYCKRFHEMQCVVCGNTFIVDLSKSDRPKTCSKECSIKYRFRDGNPFADPEKRKKALEKYAQDTGYDHPMRNPDVVSKMKQSNLSKYGKSSFTQTEEYKVACIETNQAKYGVDWPMQNEAIKEKSRKTCNERYGVDNVFQNALIQSKWKQRYQEITGYAHPMKNPSVQKKVQETVEHRYGNKYILATEYGQNSYKNTMNNRYGVDYPIQDPEIKNRIVATNLRRYGSKSYLGSKQNRFKLEQIVKARYGTPYYSQSALWKSSRMNDPSKIDDYMKFLDDTKSYLESFDTKPTYHQLENQLGVSATTISFWVNKLNLQDYIKYTLSSMEDAVVNTLHDIDPSIRIVRHDRQTIKPLELDIMLPELQIAIECNPTVTHNSSIQDPWGASPKPYNYHLSKTQKCESAGVLLFHIFGYEWVHNRPVIESMLRNLLNKNDTKIYARKCEVREVSSEQSAKFLDANHRQGRANSPIRLGLFYDNQLVSLMTFGKLRSTMGRSADTSEECYELVRFCSLRNTTVIGGADKLFKYFVNHWNPQSVRSFSDRAHTRGTLYSKLGFTRKHESSPGYVWVDGSTDIAYHRMNSQKRNIKRFLHDPDIDLNQSEREIMIGHGFVQMFDCGTILWEWSNTQQT